MVLGMSIAVTKVPSVYQWAEIHKIALGLVFLRLLFGSLVQIDFLQLHSLVIRGREIKRAFFQLN